jgi:hypothetical protein
MPPEQGRKLMELPEPTDGDTGEEHADQPEEELVAVAA